MTYTEKLRHPLWQKRRLEILSRDHFTCTLCGDKDTELHIHHNYYTDNTEPWEYQDDALTTHCRHCHAVVETEKTVGRTVVLVAKKVPYNDNSLMSLFAMSEDAEGEQTVSIYLYNEKLKSCEIIVLLSADSCERIKTLFELSEKL